MARASKPIEHGTDAGYRKGCRLACCRDAHAHAQRDYRAAKKAAALAATSETPLFEAPLTPPQTDVPDPANMAPGRIETALMKELERLDPIVPFKDTLKELALFNTRVLDQTWNHTRFDIISGLESRTLEVLARLRSVMPDLPPEEDEHADAAASLLEDLENA